MHQVLFKHLPSHFADRLVEEGEVRIGTLYEYRDFEKHGEGVLDTQEGMRETYLDIDSLVLKGGENHPFIDRFIKVDNGGTVALENVRLQSKETSPDCWIYCTSTVGDQQVGANLSSNYDACVRIDDPHAFMAAIWRAFMPLVFCMGWWQCQYVGRVIHYNDRTHPVQIKEDFFSHQKEVRAVFFKPKAKPKPFVIKIPQLKNLVTRIK